MLYFSRYLLVEENFDTFQQYLQQSGMTFPQLLQKLQANQPTGKGGNADFYKIPGTQFGIRVERHAQPTQNQQLTPAHDPHGGENVGQPVAHFGNNIQVLRLQQGTPAAFPYGIQKGDPNAENNAVATFKQQIVNAANIPDAEYERLLKQILQLNQQGYAVDPSKSGNLLVDAQNGRLNLVDLNKLEPTNQYRNNAGDIILMLMGNFHFEKYLHADKEMQGYAQQIIKKVEAASQKTGLPINRDNTSVDFSYQLANGQYQPPAAFTPTQSSNQDGTISFNMANDVW